MFNYKGLMATKEMLKVSDAQVDQQIDKLLEQHQKNTVITGRPAQLGDEIVLDYAGFLGEEQFQGGTAEKQTLVLGSGMFIPGFEDQLVGKNPGDEADVHVTFPEKYHAPELAGKAVVFKCKVHEIRVKEKYQPDDTFAREVGGFDSFAEFREALRQSMQNYVDAQADMDLKNSLLEQICAGYECEIADDQLQKAIDMEIQALEAQLGRQGLNLDLYSQFTGKSRDELRDEYAPDARKNIQRQMIIAEIAREEQIEASEADVAAEIQRVCRENNMTVEQLQPYLSQEFESAMLQNIIANKALDKLVEYARVTVVNKEV